MEKKLLLMCLCLINLVGPAFSATMDNPYVQYADPVIITFYDANNDGNVSLAITNIIPTLYYSSDNNVWNIIDSSNISLAITQKQDIYFKLNDDTGATLTFQGVKNNGYSTVIIQWKEYSLEISVLTPDNNDYLGPKINSSSPPVPLPGSAVLLGSGLLGLALVWRRQQRRR